MPITGAPPAAPGVTFDGTKVYDANAPIAWTDLNLSAYVGANKALVFLRVDSGGGLAWFQFRRNGLGRNIGYSIAHSTGTAAAAMSVARSGYILVPTDDAGIIEWQCDNARPTALYLVAYWK